MTTLWETNCFDIWFAELWRDNFTVVTLLTVGLCLVNRMQHRITTSDGSLISLKYGEVQIRGLEL